MVIRVMAPEMVITPEETTVITPQAITLVTVIKTTVPATVTRVMVITPEETTVIPLQATVTTLTETILAITPRNLTSLDSQKMTRTRTLLRPLLMMQTIRINLQVQKLLTTAIRVELMETPTLLTVV